MNSQNAVALLNQKVLSTGEISAVLGCSQQTVIRLIDCPENPLGGWKVPGSRFRRASPPNVIAYARANKLELPPVCLLVATTLAARIQELLYALQEIVVVPALALRAEEAGRKIQPEIVIYESNLPLDECFSRWQPWEADAGCKLIRVRSGGLLDSPAESSRAFAELDASGLDAELSITLMRALKDQGGYAMENG